MDKKVKTIYINGMQCNHCKMSVEKALNQIDGIINVQVSLDDKKAIIECEDHVTNDSIKKSIEEEGFTVYDIK